jgi:hypothetical protein
MHLFFILLHLLFETFCRMTSFFFLQKKIWIQNSFKILVFTNKSLKIFKICPPPPPTLNFYFIFTVSEKHRNSQAGRQTGDGGFMLSRAWYPVLNLLSKQKVGWNKASTWLHPPVPIG